MEGYVRDGRPRRLAVEALEERALLSSSPFDHFLPSPLPPDHSPLTAALAGYLESVVPALRALPPAETALLAGKLEAVAEGAGLGPALLVWARGGGPDHEGPRVESVERERGEPLRAAMLELVAACAADARVMAEGETASRTAPSAAPARPPSAEAGPVAVAAAAAAPGRDADGRGGGAALLRGEADGIPPAAPPPAEPPAESAARGAGAPEAAPLIPPESTEAAGFPARAAALLEGGLPLDLPALKREVDEFFARLADLGDGGDGWHACARFGPWLIVLTAGAIEVARGWKKRPPRRAAPGDEVVIGPGALLTEDE